MRTKAKEERDMQDIDEVLREIESLKEKKLKIFSYSLFVIGFQCF